MSLNSGLASYEPLLQPTQSQKLRKEAILIVFTVALIALSSQLLFGQSSSKDFLGNKNQVSLAELQDEFHVPGSYINVFADRENILGLSYKIGKYNKKLYQLRDYNPLNRNWVDKDATYLITRFKVNAAGKRVMIQESGEFMKTEDHEYLIVPYLRVFNGDVTSYVVSHVLDAAVDSSGKVHAIALKDFNEYEGKFQHEVNGVQLYSSKEYRNVEVYQDQVVLVKADGTLEGFYQICVKEISAGAQDGGALFAIQCSDDPNETLGQVLRWNKPMNTWEEVEGVSASKIAVVSNTKIYVIFWDTITEYTLSE